MKKILRFYLNKVVKTEGWCLFTVIDNRFTCAVGPSYNTVKMHVSILYGFLFYVIRTAKIKN